MRYKEVLKKYGLTQNELADRLGINRVSVSRLLSDGNDMRVSTIIKIANAIGCTPGEMLDDDNKTESDLIALIRYKGQMYQAETIEELEGIVEKLNKKKEDE